MSNLRPSKCLICDRKLKESEDGPPEGTGVLKYSADFGSEHDQLATEDKLLACDYVVAYICDSCFTYHKSKFLGYNCVSELTRIV